MTQMKERIESTPTEEKVDLLVNRIDKLEEALQSMIESRQHSIISNQAHFQADQVNSHQHTGEDWSVTAVWSPEGQAEVYQQEDPPWGEWSWAEEGPSCPSYTEPYPTSTQTPTWPVEYPNYQPHPESPSHECNPPTFQLDYSNHYPSCPSHPYQTYPTETGDYCPTWSDEDLQTLNNQFYPDRTCPDQPQYQPHPQQSSERTSEENQYVNSAEGKSERATASQWNVQGCTGSETEMVMKMQHTYEEQQSDLDNVIRQVALLTEIMGEMKKNRAESEVNGNKGVEKEGVSEAKEEAPANAERKSGEPLEKVEAVEAESGEEEMLTEGKSITTSPDDDVPQEALEGAHNEPPGKDEEVIKRGRELDNTLLYL